MGSIFKRTRKRSVPKDAEFITERGKTMVVWGSRDHQKRKSALSDDGLQILVKSQTYYMKYVDENGIIQIKNTDVSDRQMAQQVLANREKRVEGIKAGLIDLATERIQDPNQTGKDQSDRDAQEVCRKQRPASRTAGDDPGGIYTTHGGGRQ